MVKETTVKLLCDMCGKRAGRRVRIAWVGEPSRTVDLCDEHAWPIDDILVSAAPHRRRISDLPVAALPDIHTRPPETALSREKKRSVGEGKGPTSRASRSKKPPEGGGAP